MKLIQMELPLKQNITKKNYNKYIDGDKMDKFTFEKPSLERKEDALEYIKEILENNNSETDGTNMLKYFIDNYEGWLKKIENEEYIISTEFSVPSKTYFFVRISDKKIIGMTNIRLELNNKLKYIGGHIGYNIRPSERGKGYNKIQLYLALLECQKNGLDTIILNCMKNNFKSANTITSLGGILINEGEKTYYNQKVVIQEYIINVDDALEKYKDIYEYFIDNDKIISTQHLGKK